MKYDLKFSKEGIGGHFGRIKRIQRRLSKELMLKPDDIILDIGCNNGSLVSHLRPGCKEAIGIDINKEAVEKSNVEGLHFMDARKLSFPDGKFTKIVSSHTIEHITGLDSVFKEIDRVLKPGGLVVLCYPWEIFKGMSTMRNAWKFFKNPFMGYKIHVNKLNHNKIKKLVKNTNLKIIKKNLFLEPNISYLSVLLKD